jgi:hypothetical protein
MINQDRLFPGLLTLRRRQVYESNLFIGKVWIKLANSTNDSLNFPVFKHLADVKCMSLTYLLVKCELN